MTIQLIAGHGAGDCGATAKHNGVSYREDVEARTLVGKIALALADYDVTVNIYPTERDAYRDKRFGDLALAGDFVCEVHFNACAYDAGDGKNKGTEVLLSPNALPKSQSVAKALSAAVALALGIPDRGVKTQSLAVQRAAGERSIPAVLLEVCFLDDADDFLRYDLHRDETAKAVAQALATALGVRKKSSCSPWAEADCRWAVEKGLFRGDGDSFRWNAAVTREELAAVLHRLDP